MDCSRWTFKILGKPHEKVNSVEYPEFGPSESDVIKALYNIIPNLPNNEMTDVILAALASFDRYS